MRKAQSTYDGTVTAAFTALWSAYAGAVLTHNATYAAAWQTMQAVMISADQTRNSCQLQVPSC